MYANFPIKDIDMINKMKDLLLKKEQNLVYLLFILSINTGMKLKDLLNLKVKDVKNKQYLHCDKNKSVPINDELQDSINKLIMKSKIEEPLFKNRQKCQLNRVSAFNIFKGICTELGVQDKYSVASWRKTFAYHYYQKYKDLSYLQWLFNQSTVEQTLKYIGIDENMNLRFRDGVCL